MTDQLYWTALVRVYLITWALFFVTKLITATDNYYSLSLHVGKQVLIVLIDFGGKKSDPVLECYVHSVNEMILQQKTNLRPEIELKKAALSMAVTVSTVLPYPVCQAHGGK